MSQLNTQPVTKEAADALFAEKRFPEAIEAYRAFLANYATSAPAMKGLGMALTMSGNPTEGAEYCRKASVLQPTEAEFRYAYGYALGALKRFDEAIPELDAAVQLNPNHVPARQALVYSLITQGKAEADSNPDKAAGLFERAHKLDRQNADTIAGLLSHYLHNDQARKAVKLIQDLDTNQREHKLVQPFIEQLSKDPAIAAVISGGQGGPAVKTGAPTQTFKEVPCPKCALPIMDFAAICPHCGFQNRAVGTFAGRDTGPDHNWQDIAYMVGSGIWTLIAIRAVIVSLGFGFGGVGGFFLVLSLIQLGIGVGLLLKMEWIAFVAKLLFYFSVLSGGLGAMWAFALHKPIDGIVSLLQFGIACLMIYLIGYEFD